MTEDREQLAAWMIDHGFTTGHGDTIDDLLSELSAQMRERASWNIRADKLLHTIRDKYQSGVLCYQDPELMEGFLGVAINLGIEDEVNLLDLTAPRGRT